MGYHYPRSYKTRNLCLNGYYKFLDKYNSVIDNIKNNYYCISNNSFIDFETYKQIFNNSSYDHTFVKNTFINNIDNDIINVNEKIINNKKTKKLFKNILKNCKFLFNYNVNNLENKNEKVIINNEYYFDLVLNCTNNQLPLSNTHCIYEKTISLMYKRIKKKNMIISV